MVKRLRLTSIVALTGLTLLSIASPLKAQTRLGLHLGQSEELSLAVDGRLTFESALFLPENKSNYLWGKNVADAEPFRMSPGVTISQARLALVTKYQSWTGRIDVNFAGQKVRLSDTYIRYAYSERGDITLGHLYDPISIGLNTSSRHVSLIMPTVVTFLTPVVRHIGITLTQWGRRYWFSGGLYAGGIVGTTSGANRYSEGYGVATRAAWLPICSEGDVLHLGVSASTRTPERRVDPTGGMLLAAHGSSAVDERNFVQTKLPNVQRYEIFGAEAAYRNTKFYAQGEFLLTNVGYTPESHARRPEDIERGLFVSPEAYERFFGGYLTTSYMLRGEQRAYNRRSATFRNTADELLPGGNLELIARLGYLDADQGGRLAERIAGINWYPNPYIVLGASYTYGNMDARANAGGYLHSKALAEEGLRLHTLRLRAQFVF